MALKIVGGSAKYDINKRNIETGLTAPASHAWFVAGQRWILQDAIYGSYVFAGPVTVTQVIPGTSVQLRDSMGRYELLSMNKAKQYVQTRGMTPA